jgi:hypothetical protein
LLRSRGDLFLIRERACLHTQTPAKRSLLATCPFLVILGFHVDDAAKPDPWNTAILRAHVETAQQKRGRQIRNKSILGFRVPMISVAATFDAESDLPAPPHVTAKLRLASTEELFRETA